MRVLYCRSSTNRSKAWICLLVVVCCGDDTVVQLAEEANVVDGDLDGGGAGEVELDLVSTNIVSRAENFW